MTTKKQPALYPIYYAARPTGRAKRTILTASSALILAGTGPLTWQYLRENDTDRQARRPALSTGVPAAMPVLSGTQAPEDKVARYKATDLTQALHNLVPWQMNSRGDILGVLPIPLPPAPPRTVPVPPRIKLGQPRVAYRYDLYLYRNGTHTRIGSLPPVIASHFASLNEQGQVACALRDGILHTLSGGPFQAPPQGHIYLWQNGKCEDLGISDYLKQQGDSYANGGMLLQSDIYLNNAGNVAISYSDALLWRKGRWTPLGLSMLCGLGAGGQVVGRPIQSRRSMESTEGLANLVFYEADTQARSAYSVGQDTVLDVNEVQGLVTSRTFASMMEGRVQYSHWRDNQLTPIATVPASSSARCFLNDKSQIAGIARGISYSQDGTPRRIPGRGPLFWENNTLYQLDDLLTEADQRVWELSQVLALNNKGDLLCYAIRKGETKRRILLLTRPGSSTPDSQSSSKPANTPVR